MPEEDWLEAHRVLLLGFLLANLDVRQVVSSLENTVRIHFRTRSKQSETINAPSNHYNHKSRLNLMREGVINMAAAVLLSNMIEKDKLTRIAIEKTPVDLLGT